MAESTPLSPPPDLPYPLKITRLTVTPGQSVQRGDRLMEYTFMSSTRRRDLAASEQAGKTPTNAQRMDDMVGSWESPISGEVLSWDGGIRVGLRLDRRQATKPLIHIEQPCSHPVQIHGMCGICGADLTNADYLSRPAQEQANKSGPSRYPGGYELAHDALGVTVSKNEARRLETITRDSLLESRRLSLIVDLDQTIIHTTVDPTVGEWMNEIAEDEKEESSVSATKMGPSTNNVKPATGSTTPPSSPPRKREKNPNAEALRDVARFQLADDLPPGAVRNRRGPEPMRWYYTKPRPGLNGFLTSMSKIYEMHVYTMGTRTYADAICKVIDPKGQFFGGRILSRDESGSMSSKNLTRLFPTDQSMVVVIDDRSDVWGDCPNLVKVVPYDFFVGIGDINGSFLPPAQPTVTPIPKPGNEASAASSPSSVASTLPLATPPDIPSQEEGLLRQSKLLDDLASARPLAKLEEESEKESERCSEHGEGSEESPMPSSENGKDEESTGNKTNNSETAAPVTSSTEPEEKAAVMSTPAEQQTQTHHHVHHRKQLLNPSDHELDRIADILSEIHTGYYQAYDSRSRNSSSLPLQCDTPLLIEELKDKVLQGCVIAFTGVIPTNVEPERSDIWVQAETYGAQCVHDLSDRVTHVVTAAIGTDKMLRAARLAANGSLKVVWLAWLQQSMALWQRQDEGPYLAIDVQKGTLPGQAGATSSNQLNDVDGYDTDADGDVNMRDVDGDGEDALLALDEMWDEDAQREFDEFLEDSDSEAMDTDVEETADKSKNEPPSPASTVSSASSSPPATSPPSPTRSRCSTPGFKHVGWADDENLPLESFREPAPGMYPSPPRKKRRMLMLTAPTSDDDVPAQNRMVWKSRAEPVVNHNGPDGNTVEGEAKDKNDQENDGEETEAEEEEEEDEFAKMLQEELSD